MTTEGCASSLNVLSVTGSSNFFLYLFSLLLFPKSFFLALTSVALRASFVWRPSPVAAVVLCGKQKKATRFLYPSRLFFPQPHTIMEGDHALFAHASVADHDVTDIWCAQRSDSMEHTTESTADDGTADSGDDADVYGDCDSNYYGPLHALIADDGDDGVGSDAIADVPGEDTPHAFAYDGHAVGDDDTAAYGDWPHTEGDDATWPLQSYETPSAQDKYAHVAWSVIADTLPSDIGDLLPVYQDIEDPTVGTCAPDNVNALGHYDPAFDLFYANVLAGASPVETLTDGDVDGDSTAVAMDAVACLDEAPTFSGRLSSVDLDVTERGVAAARLDGPADNVQVDVAIYSDVLEDVAGETAPVAQIDATRANEPAVEPYACTPDARSPAFKVEEGVAAVGNVRDGSCGPETCDGSAAIACEPDVIQPLTAAETTNETTHDITAQTTANPDPCGDDSHVGDDVGDNDGGDDDPDQLVIASFDPINVPTQSAALYTDALAPEKEEEKEKADPASEPGAGACVLDGNTGDQAMPSGESVASPAAVAVEPIATGASLPTDSAPSSASSSSSWWSPWSWWSGKAAPAGTASAASDARLKAPGLVLTKADLDSVKLRPVSNRGPRPPVAATPDGVLGQLLGLFGGIAATSAPVGGSSNGVDSTRPPSVRALVAAMEGASTHSA